MNYEVFGSRVLIRLHGTTAATGLRQETYTEESYTEESYTEESTGERNLSQSCASTSTPSILAADSADWTEIAGDMGHVLYPVPVNAVPPNIPVNAVPPNRMLTIGEVVSLPRRRTDLETKEGGFEPGDKIANMVSTAIASIQGAGIVDNSILDLSPGDLILFEASAFGCYRVPGDGQLLVIDMHSVVMKIEND